MMSELKEPTIVTNSDPQWVLHITDLVPQYQIRE